jgi:hypothetical protein
MASFLAEAAEALKPCGGCNLVGECRCWRPPPAGLVMPDPHQSFALLGDPTERGDGRG